MKINDIIGTISSLNDTIENTEQQLVPLFTARRFLFLHLEFLIHHSRVQELVKQLQNDITLIRQYLDVHSTGKLTPVLVDPHHLRKELSELTNNYQPHCHFLKIQPLIFDISINF